VSAGQEPKMSTGSFPVGTHPAPLPAPGADLRSERRRGGLGDSKKNPIPCLTSGRILAVRGSHESTNGETSLRKWIYSQAPARDLETVQIGMWYLRQPRRSTRELLAWLSLGKVRLRGGPSLFTGERRFTGSSGGHWQGPLRSGVIYSPAFTHWPCCSA
jgi:hypothetical protein